MTDQEYEAKKLEIENVRQSALESLNLEYVLSNTRFKVGDIIEDHYHKIKIKSIDYDITLGKICAFYKGVELKKDSTPKKRQDAPLMYGSNIKGGWKK